MGPMEIDLYYDFHLNETDTSRFEYHFFSNNEIAMRFQWFLIEIKIPFAYVCKTLFADLIMQSESPLRHLGTSVAAQIETEKFKL